MNVAVAGGIQPYTKYVWNNLPLGCGPAETETAILICTPSAAGDYTISVTVVDSAGN